MKNSFTNQVTGSVSAAARYSAAVSLWGSPERSVLLEIWNTVRALRSWDDHRAVSVGDSVNSSFDSVRNHIYNKVIADDPVVSKLRSFIDETLV